MTEPEPTSSEDFAQTDRLIRRRRPLLPLAGIILSLLLLLLVPVFVRQRARELRDRILRHQAPAAIATEVFRSAAVSEAAANRMHQARGAPEDTERLIRSMADRQAAFAHLMSLTPELGREAGAHVEALESSTRVLDDIRFIAPADSAAPVVIDTVAVWSLWDEVNGTTEQLRSAVEAEMSATADQIDSLERVEFALTALLALLALTSAIVAARLEGQIRAAARESERARREQQILLESSGEGVLGIDASGQCTFLNPAGARLIGYPEDDVLGRDPRSLVLEQAIAPDGGMAFPTSRAFGGGELGQVEEIALRRKDGAVVEAECMTSPVIQAGAVRGAVVTLRDISQRKAAERERLALLQREQLLRQRAESEERRAKFLADASGLFVGSLDLDTTVDNLASLLVPAIADSCIVYLMDEQAEIQRLQPVHVDPERQRILVEQLDRYPPRLESLIPPIRHALLDGEPTLIRAVQSDDVKGVPGDDSHHSVVGIVGLESLIVVPLRARGRVIGAISYGVADPERRYGPDDLTLAEDLATLAGLAIDNARLYQQSQAAVRARNEVLGIVSHDLRNPLNAVRFGAQALLHHWPPEGEGEVERNQLGAITKAADRMHRLIRDLLDLAQIDAGRLAIEPAPVPIAILLDDALEFARPAAEDRSITLTLGPHTNLPVVNVDSERILQVFSNLLNNAIKFSPPDSTIAVSTRLADSEVVFSVQDEGRGIEPVDMHNIFEGFWTSRNDVGGAGLGLAIARGIIESHGGRIWVESEVGRGSTFYFSLPLSDESGRANEPNPH